MSPSPPKPGPTSVAAADPTRVVEGSGQLPRTHGQIWRTYDLSPYVDSIRNVAKPEQAVLDWVLRDTGTDVWFSQPFGLLSMEAKSLHVYHTPAMHETVKQVVDRLNRSRGESYQVHVRLMTVGSPNWRSRAFGTLQPVAVQTPGVEAWLVTKENAALLVAELQRRLDVTEFDASTLSIVNGQTFAAERRRPTTYVKTVTPAPDMPAGYATVQGSIDQGYQLQVTPLISEGDRIVDAVIRLRVDQVEKLLDVPLDVPSPSGKTQRVDVQVPQVSSTQLHERFRWPADAVLLISGGMGAAPGAEAGKNVLGLPGGILEPTPARADGLMFVEIQGRASQANVATPRTAETWSVSGGRY